MLSFFLRKKVLEEKRKRLRRSKESTKERQQKRWTKKRRKKRKAKETIPRRKQLRHKMSVLNYGFVFSLFFSFIEAKGISSKKLHAVSSQKKKKQQKLCFNLPL
jgi:hypothetical protein